MLQRLQNTFTAAVGAPVISLGSGFGLTLEVELEDEDEVEDEVEDGVEDDLDEVEVEVGLESRGPKAERRGSMWL